MNLHARLLPLLFTTLFVFACASLTQADPADSCSSSSCPTDRGTSPADLFGINSYLRNNGISLTLGLTGIYQANVHGGLSTSSHHDRFSGSYDVELGFDLNKLFSLRGASILLAAEGSWNDGINAHSLGSFLDPNADANGDRTLDVTQLYYEQSLCQDRLRIRVGKLDLTGTFECRGCPVSFDGNTFANDETTQFLNAAFVNNPAIPFPEPGLGFIIHAEILPWWYVSGGIADGDADARTTGFSTAFDGSENQFYIAETGITPQIPCGKTPLQGAYRVGYWIDDHTRTRLDGSRLQGHDSGVYVSCDQMLWRENAAENDSQGLGAFFRWGNTRKGVNPIRSFWSAGAQYRGLLPSRDDDVVAVAFGRVKFDADAGLAASSESVVETYYNAAVTPWLSVSPSVQYIRNPGGDDTLSDAIVLGLRAQVTF